MVLEDVGLMKVSDMSFIALELLDDVYGPKAFMNEALSERLPFVYRRAIDRAEEYGHGGDEVDDFALNEVGREIWNAYSGGDTAFGAARRIIEAWNHQGALS